MIKSIILKGSAYEPRRKNRSRYSVLRNEKQPKKILIHGSPYTLTENNHGDIEAVQGQSIVIEDGVITGLFPKEEARKLNFDEFDLIYDAEQRGGIVITPGFVNAHAHPPMYMLRGTLVDREADLSHSLAGMAAIEGKMTDEEFYLGAVGDLTEQQRAGITTALSHYGVFDPIERAAKDAQMRVINAVSAVSNSHPENTPEFVERIVKQGGYFTEPAIAIHYPHKADAVVFAKLRKMMDEYGVRFTMHTSENQQSVDDCMRVHGKRPIYALKAFGVLGPQLILSHAVHLDREEIELLRDTKTAVVHLPTSNLLHRSGHFKYPLFVELGAEQQIALGTDSVVSKNRLDMLTEALQMKTLHQETFEVSYANLFKMMTSQGARLLGYADVGRVAVGFKADLAFWKLKDRGFLPFDRKDPSTLIANMITHGGRNIRDLMVGGKFVISNRMHNYIDESSLLENIQEVHEDLRKRAT
ncbi:MAG: amidohydrolase family protein [Patescibacteria group bacterium]|jgi:5-methylthioadenosine/S-adenosylhomocysteine deaminase